MPRVVFYQMPPSAHWPAVAQLVASLLSHGKLSVIVSSDEEARHLSRALWALPPSIFVPHGIAGDDADDRLDPVVISIGVPAAERPVVIQASVSPTGALCTAELIAETVPGDERLREASRKRFKAYKDSGLKPCFVSWEVWASAI